MKKIITTSIILLLVFTGYRIILNIHSSKNIINNSIQPSTNNNNIQEIDMEYISNDDLDLKIDYFSMDDINLFIAFNFKFNENIKNYDGITLGNFKIVDEENRQIHLDTESDKHYNNYSLLNSNWNLTEKNNNTIKQSLTLISNNFPKSNTLYISFNKITLYSIKNGNAETKEYNGNWNIAIDATNMQNNRKTINYTTSNNAISNVKATNSGLVLDIKMTFDRNLKIRDENDKEYPLVNIVGKKDNINKTYIENEYIVFFNMSSYNASDKIYLETDHESITLIKDDS